jgi:hypothetical protein
MSEAVFAPGHPPRGLRQLLVINLGLSALTFALLELWRPLYFLTDDSLDGYFPNLAATGQRILQGRTPFVCDYLFGGNHDMLRDCIYFLWHPVYIVAALMANSPIRFFSVDFVAFVFLMLATAGFVCLAHYLRQEASLPLGDTLLTFYTLSFTYSMIVLCATSSWMPYLGNHSAMPWLALGILQKSWRRGLGLVGLFSVHHVLGGHLEVTVAATMFFTFFAAGVACCRRSWAPLLVWIGGYAVALVVISPLIVPAMEGFLASNRSEGLHADRMIQFAVPAALFPASYFLSVFSLRLHIPYLFGDCQPCYSAAFVSCAAAWAIIPAVINRKRWSGLELLCLGLVAFAALLVIRPAGVNDVLAHIPLLRSLRWPFREILELQFFLHLFFVLRPLGGPVWLRRGAISIGAFIFIAPLPLLPAPSFNPMVVDRFLLFSGLADEYWAKVKTLLGPDDVLVTIADPALVGENTLRIPFTLLGTANYPCLFQFRSGSGYSVTVPSDQLYLHAHGVMNMGIYSPRDKAAILAERPNVRFVTLESVDPLRITLSSRAGPPIDLTALPLQK